MYRESINDLSPAPASSTAVVSTGGVRHTDSQADIDIALDDIHISPQGATTVTGQRLSQAPLRGLGHVRASTSESALLSTLDVVPGASPTNNIQLIHEDVNKTEQQQQQEAHKDSNNQHNNKHNHQQPPDFDKDQM